jgi:hypothetical protein
MILNPIVEQSRFNNYFSCSTFTLEVVTHLKLFLFQIYPANTAESSAHIGHAWLGLLCHANLQVPVTKVLMLT